MTHSGWRKPTPDLGRLEELVQVGEQESIPKTRAFAAVKRVGCHIGLKAGDMMLLDTLGAFSQDQDWEAGRRPIVWPSNAYLMERTGFSLSALKRHLRRLADVGVVGFKDSPNGKRWGTRDKRGVIVEAYGIDLSPLSARATAFEDLEEDLQVERALCRRLKREITVTRRDIRARLDVATGRSRLWSELEMTFETLLSQLPKRTVASERLRRILEEFQELQDAFKLHAETTVSDHTNLASKRPDTGPHIQTTNQLKPLESSCTDGRQIAEGRSSTPTDQPAKTCNPPPDDAGAIELKTLMRSCPEFATWARDLGGYLRDWSDAYRVADQLRPMIGISNRTWADAQKSIGRCGAGVALALIIEKCAKGEVRSPGGYLRGMIRKARAGELRLERSIYGKLHAQPS